MTDQTEPQVAYLVALARAATQARNAYDASCEKERRHHLADVSHAADAALEAGMASGASMAKNVLLLAGVADGTAAVSGPSTRNDELRARADGWAATLAAGFEPDTEEAAEIGKLLSALSDALSRS